MYDIIGFNVFIKLRGVYEWMILSVLNVYIRLRRIYMNACEMVRVFF